MTLLLLLCARNSTLGIFEILQGDSGGPLICQGFQVGIVAAGIGCGLGYRSYFTKVAPFYYSFITKHIPFTQEKNLATNQSHFITCIQCIILYVMHIIIYIVIIKSI